MVFNTTIDPLEKTFRLFKLLWNSQPLFTSFLDRKIAGGEGERVKSKVLKNEKVFVNLLCVF